VKMAYARGAGGDSFASRRTRPRKTITAQASLAGGPLALVLTEAQYDHFVRCMKTKAKPTKRLQEGANLLQQLRQKKR
jgi:hypothetical protein